MALRDDGEQLKLVATWFHALSHPSRLQILDALDGGGALSPSQLCERIDSGPGLANLAYHTRALARAGLLKPAGRRPVRGALEHFYRLSPIGLELIGIVRGLSAREQGS